MSTDRATVSCADCPYEETFRNLPEARVALHEHRSETGHSPDWRIHGLSGGVERAGADAGVCGRPECANDDSPLVEFRE